MSRYSNQAGVYIPVIKASREVEAIVDIISLITVKTLRRLSETITFVDMYLADVSVNGYDNAGYDKLVQLVATMVDAERCSGSDDDIEDIAEGCVLGLAAVYVYDDERAVKLLTGAEYDILKDCVVAFDNQMNQLDRASSRSRNSGRGRVDRREYDGGRNHRASQDSYRDDYDDGYGRRQEPSRNSRGSRDSFRYRGNDQDTRRRGGRNAGRRPPVVHEDYFDVDANNAVDQGRHTTVKDRLRTQERGAPTLRRAQTVEETRHGAEVPVGGHSTSRPVRTDRQKNRRDMVIRHSETPVLNEQERLHEKEDGSMVRIIPVTQDNMADRASPYAVIPLFPITVDGYFTLNSNGDIVGVIGLPKSEEDMERDRHDASRFFKTWGNKVRDPNHRATAKALGDIQTKAKIGEIETQLAAKYDFDTLEELPVVDTDTLYVVKTMTTYEPHEDFVSTAKELLLAEVEHEHVSDMFATDIDEIPINYSAVEFYGITLTDEAAHKAMELKSLSSFGAIKNKLSELESLMPASSLYVLDSIATNWVNDLVRYTLGVENWVIDSFMSDINELTKALSSKLNISTAFTSQAINLVSTVLHPLTNKDEDIRSLTGLSEEGPFTVKFGKLTNITLIKIDSDELGLYLDGISGCVTKESWASMSMALDVVNTLSNVHTAQMLLVTSDNRKIHVSAGKNSGEYILSR